MPKFTDEDVRRRAYELWEADGQQHGSHEAHWDRAHQELLEGEADAPVVADKPAKSKAKAPSLSVVPKTDESVATPKKRGKTV